MENLLNSKGKLYIAVTYVQANTGAYWFYEDFIHNFLFTSGSLIYVLKASGFDNILFLNSYYLYESTYIKKSG